MPIPQVTDRLKEAPAVVLRAAFAGIGQLLLAAEKIRSRVLGQFSPGQAGQTAQAPPGAGQRPAGEAADVKLPHEQAAPDTERIAEGAAGPGDGAAPAKKPATGAEQPAEPAAAVPSPPTGPAGPAAAAAPTPPTGPAAAAGAPPIQGYDDLSVASLRARLRVLDAAALHSLLDYERAHAHRDTVIGMFERRLAKISGDAG